MIPTEENQYMQNILNCVYYKGQSFDIEGETGINTMRKVFSQVLGADLPPIPRCRIIPTIMWTSRANSGQFLSAAV